MHRRAWGRLLFQAAMFALGGVFILPVYVLVVLAFKPQS